MAGRVSARASAEAKDAQRRIAVLVETALRGLPGMIDRSSHLFAFTTRPTGPEGRSVRYTSISLIGLTAARRAGLHLPMAVDPVVAALVSHRREIVGIGDQGLLLWCLADYYEAVGPVQKEVLGRIEEERHRLREANTSELAWLLTGLCRTAQIDGSDVRLRALAAAAYRALRANYTDRSGLFCYGGTRGDALRRMLRRRLGFFDNQVYGIYAGAAYYAAFGDAEARKMAVGCARRITAAQGPLGQWAWHYNAVTGAVVDRYPVYSVHQDGMAPMALDQLASVGGEDHEREVELGIAWLFGKNEMERPLVNQSAGVIWRSIRRKALYSQLIHLFKLLSVAGYDRLVERLGAVANTRDRLEVDLECRPYHLGWLLLALTKRGASWS